MEVLLDTNILLRALDRKNSISRDIRHALKLLHRRGEKLCVIPQNIVEFWAVATRPVAANGLGLTTFQAVAQTTRIKRYFFLLPERAETFQHWERLVQQHRVAGKACHDARIVASMLANGVNTILTLNTEDFQRYSPMVTLLHPKQLLP